MVVAPAFSVVLGVPGVAGVGVGVASVDELTTRSQLAAAGSPTALEISGTGWCRKVQRPNLRGKDPTGDKVTGYPSDLSGC